MIQALGFLIPVGAAVVATNLPDPNHYGSIGWVSVVLVCIVMGLNAAFDFYKNHIRETPRPSGTYVAIADFKEFVAEIRDEIEKLGEKVEKFSSDNYRRRSAMHKKINALQSAFHYWCGRLDRKGDAEASRTIRGMISNSNEGGEDGEG